MYLFKLTLKLLFAYSLGYIQKTVQSKPNLNSLHPNLVDIPNHVFLLLEIQK